MGTESQNQLVSGDTRAKVAQRLRQFGVSTRPEVAAKLVDLLGNPDSDIADIARVVRTDAALSGRLIGLAGSAFFAQREPVTTVERACVVLGRTRVRALVFGFYLTRITTSGRHEALDRLLWGQAVYRASLCSALADHLCPEHAGEAFVAGLMLDRGVGLMVQMFSQRYLSLLENARSPQNLFELESMDMPFTHVDAMVVLLEKWMVPPVIVRAVGMHHDQVCDCVPDEPGQVIACIARAVGRIELGHDEHPTADSGAGDAIADSLEGATGMLAVAAISSATAEYKATCELFDDVAEAFNDLGMLRERVQRQLAGIIDDALRVTMDEAVHRMGKDTTGDTHQAKDAA